ncbi:MAG: TetR/AcrR family transcriptional regulator [Myxococcota bacterium]|nr:TetR/AcrR family transcriptional regulator [Myxococcota bacterium]
MSRQPRAEATRARLLSATLESLHERGYSGTSTQEVCRRAGVSRGTLLHHFPTRIDLLVAALDTILSERVAGFVDAHQGASMPLPILLRRLWGQWEGPVYAAWLELAVAARTEPALQAPMRSVMARFDADILAAFQTLVDTDGLPPQVAAVIPFLTFAVFNGLAVGWGYNDSGQEEPVLELLERLAGLLPILRGVL